MVWRLIPCACTESILHILLSYGSIRGGHFSMLVQSSPVLGQWSLHWVKQNKKQKHYQNQNQKNILTSWTRWCHEICKNKKKTKLAKFYHQKKLIGLGREEKTTTFLTFPPAQKNKQTKKRNSQFRQWKQVDSLGSYRPSGDAGLEHEPLLYGLHYNYGHQFKKMGGDYSSLGSSGEDHVFSVDHGRGLYPHLDQVFLFFIIRNTERSSRSITYRNSNNTSTRITFCFHTKKDHRMRLMRTNWQKWVVAWWLCSLLSLSTL